MPPAGSETRVGRRGAALVEGSAFPGTWEHVKPRGSPFPHQVIIAGTCIGASQSRARGRSSRRRSRGFLRHPELGDREGASSPTRVRRLPRQHLVWCLGQWSKASQAATNPDSSLGAHQPRRDRRGPGPGASSRGPCFTTLPREPRQRPRSPPITVRLPCLLVSDHGPGHHLPLRGCSRPRGAFPGPGLRGRLSSPRSPPSTPPPA